MVKTKITRIGGKSGDSAHSEGNGGQSSTNLHNQRQFIELINELTRTVRLYISRVRLGLRKRWLWKRFYLAARVTPWKLNSLWPLLAHDLANLLDAHRAWRRLIHSLRNGHVCQIPLHFVRSFLFVGWYKFKFIFPFFFLIPLLHTMRPHTIIYVC